MDVFCIRVVTCPQKLRALFHVDEQIDVRKTVRKGFYSCDKENKGDVESGNGMGKQRNGKKDV